MPKIAVIPGDGTGPEVVREGLKVLEAAARQANLSYETVMYPFGGEHYLKTGETLPDSAIAELRGCAAIFLGAIGHPDVKPGILERDVLLKLRFSMDQYINLRPVKLYPGVWTPLKDKGPEQIDFVVCGRTPRTSTSASAASSSAGRRTRWPPSSASTPAKGSSAASDTPTS